MAALDVPEAAQGDNAADERSCASPRTAVPPPPQPTAVIATPLAAWPARDGCLYQRCYCEENIYWLARTLVQQLPAPWRLFAVFISNPGKSVPLWRQQSAAAPDLPVLWDYHVLLLAQLEGQPTLVLDLDSTLPFPCPLSDYRRAALLGDDSSLAPQYRRCYRVVPARLLLSQFASDRSHMVGQGGEGWLAPPPPWPCLVAESGATNTLPVFLDFGEVGGAVPGSDGAEVEAAGKRDSETVTGEQPKQQRQSATHTRSQQHGPAAQESGAAVLSDDGPPFGTVLREPAFLGLFGVGT